MSNLKRYIVTIQVPIYHQIKLSVDAQSVVDAHVKALASIPSYAQLIMDSTGRIASDDACIINVKDTGVLVDRSKIGSHTEYDY